jgi:predicted permease
MLGVVRIVNLVPASPYVPYHVGSGDVTIDGRVLAFTIVISIISGVLFGLAPALRSTRAGLQHRLADAGRRSSGAAVWGRRSGGRWLLVVAELALAVMLLIGAGLLIRSFVRLQQVHPGFTASNVLTLELTMTGRKYAGPPQVLEASRELWTRLAALPGVTAAGGVSMLPLSQMFAWGPIVLEGRPLPGGEAWINVDQRTVGSDYFAVMQIPLLKGRLFTEHDTMDSPRVVVVDDRMAAALWPNEDPLGKRLRRGGMDASEDAPWLTVVGVVGSVKQYTLDETDSRIAMYHPHTQVPGRSINVVVRTTTSPESVASSVVNEIRRIDPDLPIYNLRSMESRVEASLAPRRFAVLLLTLFAGVALILAGIGVYGVIAYLVSQGVRDIGIRLALGATPSRVLAMIVSQGLIAAVLGVAIGVAGALAHARAMQTLLFGIAATDPLTYSLVALTLVAAALLGAYVPARRAAQIDPVLALRAE